MAQYKNIEDYVHIQKVSSNYTGYDNPEVTVTLKMGKFDETHERMIKSCIGEALLRFATLSQIPIIPEVKQ